MKKIIYFIFAFLMSFSLFSCSDDEDISEIKKDAKADFLSFSDSWKEPSKYSFSYSYTGNGFLSDTAKSHGSLSVTRNRDSVVLSGDIAESLQSWYDDEKKWIDDWHSESETSTDELYLDDIAELDSLYASKKSECCVLSISEMLELLNNSWNDVSSSADENTDFNVQYSVSGNVKYPSFVECPDWTKKYGGTAESGFRIEITEFSVTE